MTVFHRISLASVVLCSIIGAFQVGVLLGESSEAEQPGQDSLVQLRELQAEAFSQLQEARLRQAEEMNRRVPDSLSDADIQNLKRNVALGQQLRQSSRDGEKSSRNSVYLLLAQNAVDLSETKLAKAKAVQAKLPNMYSDTDIEVVQRTLELRKLNLAVGQEALERSTTDEFRWKLDLLYDEILRLRNEVKISRRNR